MNERLTRVAIVGFCQDSRDMAPYEDETIEVWGLNRGYIFMQRANRWFELHGPHIHGNQVRRPGKHLEWLRKFPGPVYMHRDIPELPNSVTYPLAEVAEAIGANLWRRNAKGDMEHGILTPYISSSISFQIALAIYEGFEEIQLWGIDLNTESEYAWQKPGVEHLIGVALGRGIRVILPDNCPLLKAHLYGRGYLAPEGERMSLEVLERRAKALEVQANEVSRQLAELTGAKRELGYLMEQMIPGLDHERMDDRRKQMVEATSQMQQKLVEIQGARNETAYWISQTPQGQDPAQAIEQISGNGHKALDADGPITELQLMQSPKLEILEPVFSGA